MSGTNLFVGNFGTEVPGSGGIGEYTTSGETVNVALVAGLHGTIGIAVSGEDLFVLNLDGTVGEYTTSGQTVNAALITGLVKPQGIAVSGTNLFIGNFGTGLPGSGAIGEYTTSGETVNAA